MSGSSYFDDSKWDTNAPHVKVPKGDPPAQSEAKSSEVLDKPKYDDGNSGKSKSEKPRDSACGSGSWTKK